MKNVRINIITPFITTGFARQFSEKTFPNLEIIENGHLDDFYDAIVVYEDVPSVVKINSYRGNLIFITGEPPISRKYPENFLNQFDYIISCHEKLKHSNNILTQQSLPWQFGYDYINSRYKYNHEQLKHLEFDSKTKKMSIIASGKSMMPGHIQRLRFIEKLKEYFSDQIDFFGRDSNPVIDKADAILPFMSSICIENTSIENYWTEKIADVFLGYSLPIYHGCSNIHDYFPADSLISIDIENISMSLEIIDYVLSNCEKIFEERKKMILESRNLVLDLYNIQSFLSNFFLDKKMYVNADITSSKIEPASSFLEHKLLNIKLKVERYTRKILS